MLRYAVNVFTSQQLTCCWSRVACFAPVRFYPRQTRQPFNSTDSRDFRIKDDDETESYDIYTESELETNVDNTSDNDRMETEHRAWVKKKIIRRKYFQKEPELNLLSWTAKEQIRHLHDKDPIEWNVAKLAQSFPISEQGVKCLLKSNYFRTEQEVSKHDMQVRKNWTAVKLYLQENNGDINIGGPLENTVKEIVSEGKLPTMLNAGGLDNVVVPLKNTDPLDNGKKKRVGIFESIVKDYVNNENQKSKMHDSKEFISNASDKSLLTEISQMDGFDADGVQAYEVHPSRVSYNESNPRSSQTETGHSQMKTASRQERRLVQGLKNGGTLQHINLSSYQLEKLGMFDTGRIDESADENSQTEMSSDAHRNQKEDEMFSQTPQDRTQKFRDERQSVLSKVRYEKSGDSGEEVAYLYDYKSGYHYPLGQTDENLKKLDIPAAIRKKAELYQKGNYVYDNDGEFLYKIP